MHRLSWIARAPEEPGYYWFRAPGGEDTPAIVRIDDSGGELRACFTGMSVPAPLRMLAHGAWAGPIPRPCDPGDAAGTTSREMFAAQSHASRHDK